MELFEAIKNRRSIRKFKNRDVPDALIEKIIDAARWAPFSNYIFPPGTVHNHQPWEFVVVRDPKTKKVFAEPRDEENKFVADVPVVIVVCVDKSYSMTRWLEDGFMAIENMLLAAHALGLGTVIMPTYSARNKTIEDSTRAALKLPENIQPVALVCIGYPDERPEPKKQRDIKEMTHNEKW
jgi:nitroreductase